MASVSGLPAREGGGKGVGSSVILSVVQVRN